MTATDRPGPTTPGRAGPCVAFVDTETTGLDPVEHFIWEAAVVVYDTGTRCITAEQRWQLPIPAAHEPDEVALRIGRWHERRLPAAELSEPALFASELVALTAGLPLVGANPSFDEERLRRVCWRHGIEPAWHYRPICVEALAVGFLHGQQAGAARYALASGGIPPVLGVEEAARIVPWRSQEVAAALGIDRPAEEAHTALGDCRWALAIWRAVMER